MSSELEFCPRKSGRRAYVRELSSYTRAASSESALNSIFGGTARDAVLFRALMVFIPHSPDGATISSVFSAIQLT